MSNTPIFIVGQRWVSTTEPELGLGKIVSADRRFVEVAFAGNDCTRKYGAGSAPLRRVIFKPGDAIRIAAGENLRIMSVAEADSRGKVTYICGGTRVPEDAVVAASSGAPVPLERLLSGITDRCEDFGLRVRLVDLRAKVVQSPVRGFCGGRIELLPHQLHIASEVSERRRIRVLLADETGLGKTIEACFILHRLFLTGRVRRCLICVPESLVHQWFVELLRRFNLMFRLFTNELFESVKDGSNPFLNDQTGIASVTLLANDDRLCEAAVSAGWDLLIVDEAHHLREGGREYECIRRLAEKSQGLILLTATPEHSGGREQFFRLLDGLGVGRAMFRNSRREIAGFPRRIVHIVPLRGDHATILMVNNEYKNIASNIAPVPSPLSKGNPRVAWIVDLIRNASTEKFLIICARKEKAIALRDAILESLKVDIALFHEDMTLLQRDRNAAWFTEKNGARLCIASEIGSEGRNFQCCRNLVLFDLPLEPEVLEQRIGRLDRIGQGPLIHLFVPFIAGTHEETICRWYHEGMGMFEKNVPAAAMTGEAARESLTAILKSDCAEPDKAQELVGESSRLCREFSEKLREDCELSPEKTRFDTKRAEEIKKAVLQVQEKRISARIMEPLFKHYGVATEDADNGKQLLLTEYVTDRRFPLPRQERPLVTYDREIALLREDIEFISIDHPMVTDALDLFLSSDFGTSVFALAEIPGTRGPLLESLYVLECGAPENLNAARFLPPTPIRVVVDSEGRDVTGKFPCELVSGACRDASPQMLQSAMESVEEYVPPMLQAAETLAERAAKPIIDHALHEMQEALDAELERLRILRSRDRTIIDMEAELCAQEKSALEKHLAGARIRLDSIRVIWSGRA
jgi:ATP-dependent helicase HepA